ncbi:hypothetical protein C0J52_24866 [Blattella germanica]|nr:hypothetical protein C0J52_24866 [Blattella germanica]
MFSTVCFHVVVENSIRPVTTVIYYFNRGPPGLNGMLRSLPVMPIRHNWKKHKRQKANNQKKKGKLLLQVETESKPKMSTKTTKDSECQYCKGLYSKSNEGWVSCVNGHMTRALLQTVMIKTSYRLTETKPKMSTKTTKDSECLYCKGLYSKSNEGWVSCVNGHMTRALVQTVMIKTSYRLVSPATCK